MKILRFMICIIMLSTMFLHVGFSTVGNADSSISDIDIALALKTNVPEIFAALLNNPESLDIAKELVINARISQPFSMARIEKDNYILVEDILYFPIVSGNRIIAILTLIKNNGDLSCSLGKDFAPELDAYCHEQVGELTFVLFSHNGDINAVNEENVVTKIYSYEDKELDSSKIDYSNMAAYRNVINPVSIYTSDLTTVPNICNESYSIMTSGYHLLPNYSLYIKDMDVNGVQKPICWAAVVASMVNFEMDPQYDSLTAKQVCDDQNHSYTGEYEWNTPPYLSYYLPEIFLPTYVARALTESEIQVVINNVDPAYMSSYCGLTRHATALCGYYLSTQGNVTEIWLMDPAYECIKIAQKVNGYYRYAFGSQTYTWNRSIRFFYQA